MTRKEDLHVVKATTTVEEGISDALMNSGTALQVYLCLIRLPLWPQHWRFSWRTESLVFL